MIRGIDGLESVPEFLYSSFEGDYRGALTPYMPSTPHTASCSRGFIFARLSEPMEPRK